MRSSGAVQRRRVPSQSTCRVAPPRNAGSTAPVFIYNRDTVRFLLVPVQSQSQSQSCSRTFP